MTGASKTILSNKFAISKLDDVTRDPEDWITVIELLRGTLRKLGVINDNVEIMTHILSNLPELYKNILENLEDKLDDDIYMLTIKIFQAKLSLNHYCI